MTATSIPARAAPLAGPGSHHRTAVRVTLAAIAALAGLSYAWALDRDPLEPYYAAAVRSMSASWHDFAFGAFDPAGTVTLDKLPGAFWVQALTARLLGVHTWTLVLPQVIEGVLTVLVLYRAVRRLAGPGAGLTAALVLAASPAVVALNRGNVSDSLMILLVVLAADAVAAAVCEGRQWRLVVAGIWVGLAFQAKMIEAWILLPALGLTYLVAAPGSRLQRVRHVVVGGVTAGVVSMLWMLAVTVVPTGARPYVDGSHSGSLFEQVFVYNGFGRFGEQSPLQILVSQGLTLLSPGTPPGWDRLLTGDLGRDAGWLLPLALAVTITGILTRRRRPRTDLIRAGYLLWGMWTVTLTVAFSLTSTINSYYTAALAPAVAAVCGIGLVDVWAHRDSTRVRVLTAVGVAGTALYAGALLAGSGPTVPSWLLPTLAIVALAAVALLLISTVRRADEPLLRAGLGAAVLALLLVPAVASALLVEREQGVFDTPFESARTAAGIDELFIATPRLVARSLPALEKARAGAPDLLAVQSSAVASVFSYPHGQEVLPIGGFTGTMPEPTLHQLRDDIARGEFHLVLAFPTADPRLVWIAQHCRHLPGSVPPFQDYYCVPADARSPG
ncbi:MAG: ArnT family glycosyltransferase [Pseudonocardiaceae bacterium]